MRLSNLLMYFYADTNPLLHQRNYMQKNTLNTQANIGKAERYIRSVQAEFLICGAVDPQIDDRLGFKDMRLSRTAHLLAALNAFRDLLESKESGDTEKEHHRDILQHWLGLYFKATGCHVTANSSFKDIVSIEFGPNAVIQYEMLVSIGLSPLQETFWEILATNVSTTHQIEAGELFACM